MKYFVIGDDDTVLGFRYAGLEGRVAATGSDVEDALAEAAADKEIGAIIITERAADLARGQVDTMRTGSVTPVLVEIPDRHGPLPGRKTLADLIREAVGIRI